MESDQQNLLSLDQQYPCPICRQGTLEAIVLTEAFACNFCRHILSVNLSQQQVQVVDSAQALTWSWSGQRWQLTREEKTEGMSPLVIVVALTLTFLPASIVWLAGALFPPLTPAPTITFSNVWAVLTLLAHGTFVLWLIGEYYQIPFYITVKMRLLQSRVFRNSSH